MTRPGRPAPIAGQGPHRPVRQQPRADRLGLHNYEGTNNALLPAGEGTYYPGIADNTAGNNDEVFSFHSGGANVLVGDGFTVPTRNLTRSA